MECADARRIAAAWEQGAAIPAADLRVAREHAATCGSCRAAVPVFLALARREEDRGGSAEPSAEGLALADRVMAEIGGSSVAPARPRAFRRRLGRSLAAALALTLCGIFAAGLFGLVARDGQTVEVRFVLEAPEAKSVYLAGDFSSWDTEGLPLKKTAFGLWERKVRLRRGMVYSYNFLVDGTSWVVDPAAPERVEDGFGGESALLRL